MLLVLAWTLIPTVLALVLFAVGEPIELARITILMMPALALLLAWALFRPFVPPAVGILLCAALLTLRLAQVIPNYGVSPENWRAATTYVLANTPAGEPACIAFYPQDGREPFDYYLSTSGSPKAAALTPVLPASLGARYGRSSRSTAPWMPRSGAASRGDARGCGFWAAMRGCSAARAQSRAHRARYEAMERSFGNLYPQPKARVRLVVAGSRAAVQPLSGWSRPHGYRGAARCRRR